MTQARPDPAELLRRAAEEERQAARGKLVVFFGAAPGVGKTYAMLEAARSERALKRDVVVGVVETHGRYDTGALVIGLELLPRKEVTYRGVTLAEFDLDAALARRPGLLLVDELAHTNAPGCRHAKRWQDVEELLDAGVDVYTTLNVQHLESLNDVVAQVTGITVRETVPDRVLEEAAEVRLVDLPPDELLERLTEGKVYMAESAERAARGFFRKGNLIALRELALRSTAERVDAQMRTYRRAHGIAQVWPAGERLLVCVSASPSSARLVRAARRMAASLHAPLIAAYVETPAALRLSGAGRRHLADNLRLAEQLGAETVTLKGEHAAEETVRYARSRNATKIVLGKPTHARWRDVVRRSFLDDVVRTSGEVDVYVISGDAAPERLEYAQAPARGVALVPYAASAAAAIVATGLAWVLFGRRQLADVVMVYLLGVVLVSLRLGYGPSICSAVLAIVMLDFFFVPPYLSFSVSDFQHVVMFAVMFFVAVVISNLTQRVRAQADEARGREQRTARLYGMSRELAATRATRDLASVSARHVHEVFDAKVALLLEGDGGRLENVTNGDASFVPDEKEMGVVAWVWANGKPAGKGTDTLPSSGALYLPLRGALGKVGVLGVSTDDATHLGEAAPRALLDLFANQIGSALERALLAEHAQQARLQIETERLRSSLLSSVSHDLRTPLAVITGSASALVESDAKLDPAAKRDLASTIEEEARRLERLVRNLLDMTRLEGAPVVLDKDPQPLEAVIGSALGRVEDQLRGRTVTTHVAADLPLVPIDPVLVEQLLVNLLENAAKYSPPGGAIDVGALAGDGEVTVEVADRGPGVPAGFAKRIFEKFYRLPSDGKPPGAGLGLAICRAIAEAHGGRIWVDAREGGGAVFRFTLPLGR